MSVDHPVTQAVRQLRQARVAFTPHLYAYVERGGTATSAAALGVDEHAVVKTLVFEDESRAPLIILMHGDREVSQKNLARHIGKKSVKPCSPEVAEKHTGYKVGGTSPFGVRRAMPIYVEESILALPTIYINGGARGFLVGIAPDVLTTVLAAEPARVMSAE
jgi:Cys-tRNA(Pro) deacylase